MNDAHNDMNVMRYLDGELAEDERQDFELHLRSCEMCRSRLAEFEALKEVTRQMKVANLPEAAWETFWNGIYNRIERRLGWLFFIIGAFILAGYMAYRLVTDPNLLTVAGIGALFMVVGGVILFVSVFREKHAVNRIDRYIREVKR